MMMMTWLLGGSFFKNLEFMVVVLVGMVGFLSLKMVVLGGEVLMVSGASSDTLSLMLVILTVWICLIIYLVGGVWSDKVCKGLMGGIMIMLIMSFFVSSIFWFYVFFELVLIPMFLLVVVYGNYSERLESGFYMMFYTMFGSLPFLSVILSGFKEFSWNFGYLVLSKQGCSISSLTSMMVLMGFLSKLPMYGFHIWLPKAHVEAPMVGSMILAGVLLKLGGYGILRIVCLLNMGSWLKCLIVVMGVAGGITCGLMCLRQNDMKKLVAYSSVVHSGVMLSGMSICLEEGWEGGMMMLICHGLCSSGLFYIVNIVYEGTMSRSMLLVKGCGNLSPNLSMWCFIFVVMNSGCPPFLGFFSELSLCMGLLKWGFSLMLFLGLMLFLAVGYNIHFYSSVNHGGSGSILMKSIKVDGFLCIFLHFWPVLCMVISMDMFVFV